MIDIKERRLQSIMKIKKSLHLREIAAAKYGEVRPFTIKEEDLIPEKEARAWVARIQKNKKLDEKLSKKRQKFLESIGKNGSI